MKNEKLEQLEKIYLEALKLINNDNKLQDVSASTKKIIERIKELKNKKDKDLSVSPLQKWKFDLSTGSIKMDPEIAKKVLGKIEYEIEITQKSLNKTSQTETGLFND
jgi:hypothetical protein